ncbi:MAG TPA: hypothetical protein VM778_09135, partial [Gemmatimonadota bacterium]|nr:hypothetical protein [Gemmatimonadota bacterium]
MCEINIDRVEGTDYDADLGSYESVNVVGTVVGCPPSATDSQGQDAIEILVMLETSEHSRTEIVQITTHGDLTSEFGWTAYFKGVPCGGKVVVEARCLGGGDDCVAKFDDEMLCEGRLCPVVQFE